MEIPGNVCVRISIFARELVNERYSMAKKTSYRKGRTIC